MQLYELHERQNCRQRFWRHIKLHFNLYLTTKSCSICIISPRYVYTLAIQVCPQGRRPNSIHNSNDEVTREPYFPYLIVQFASHSLSESKFDLKTCLPSHSKYLLFISLQAHRYQNAIIVWIVTIPGAIIFFPLSDQRLSIWISLLVFACTVFEISRKITAHVSILNYKWWMKFFFRQNLHLK